MRILFMGTPEFALPSLEALSREEVVGVISQPDRPRGRGQRLSPPPVVQAARKLGIPCLQPERLKDPAVLAWIRDRKPELIVVVAYGRIIPPEIFRLPPLESINVHPSLLPRHRGPSPIPFAILSGDTETGVTVIYLSEEMDAGDILLQKRVPIDPEETARTLEGKLAQLGARALLEAIELLREGRAPRIPQDPAMATVTRKLMKEDGKVDWTRPSEWICRLVRAMDPWPTAYTFRGGTLLKIWRASPEPGIVGRPGEVVAVDQESILIAAGEGGVRVLEVQPAGRRRMKVEEYLRGYRVQVGEVWT
ncbi:MAG: methionyl-tRNA formyltransferase [Armatimonadota bacterium]|nr:methionyl-tRNA formyltransferase [Armatimonadota bacterium]MDR5703555.1 methionyl-tRNA formyltransferase [Armatimonadota bacterium]MDR7434954.1 methionyl-tRNA formyltransferase [Armatimonadota bacterium]